MQTNRSMDAMHNIISSFRQFEKKLDKLQDDVSYHGQTLTDLRVMLANLSGATLYDTKIDNSKVLNKTTAMDNSLPVPSPKKKRKPLQSFPQPKMITKNSQDQKYGIKPTKEPLHFNENKPASAPKTTLRAKHVMRQTKGEAPRKTTTIRPKKTMRKKSHPPRSFEYPSQFKSPIF